MGEQELNAGGISPTDLEVFKDLLKDRSFVDHFNVFLMLPVFGQHVLYSYQTKEFEFYPQIRRAKCMLDHRSILKWLCADRYPVFKMTRLYLSYQLNVCIRDVGFYVYNPKDHEVNTPEQTKRFTTNLLGTVVGMKRFRNSLLGTAGENVFSCWMDTKALRLATDTSMRMFFFKKIKMNYIHDGSDMEMSRDKKCVAFRGLLNFDVVPVSEVAIIESYLANMPLYDDVFSLESEDAMVDLLNVLAHAMRSYWVPRYVLHVLRDLPLDVIQSLFIGSDISPEEVKRMISFHRMFPNQWSTNPLGDILEGQEAFVSNTQNDDPRTVADSPESETREPEELLPTTDELLSIWGGTCLPKPTDNFECYDIDSDSSHESEDIPVLPKVHKATPSQSLDAVEANLRPVTLSHRDRIALSLMPYPQQVYMMGGVSMEVPLPNVSVQILRALSSDYLAGSPFRDFLQDRNERSFFTYMQFWNDIQNYLRVDAASIDRNGNNRRIPFARLITKKYLLSSTVTKIFSERMKMALLNILSCGRDEKLLFAARDIVSNVLSKPWMAYMQLDKRRFFRFCCGKQYIKHFNRAHPLSKVFSLKEEENAFWPTTYEYFDQSRNDVWETTDILDDIWEDYDSEIKGGVLLSEEHCWKALELTVLLSGGLRADSLELNTTKLSLSFIMRSVYGSLDTAHISQKQPENLADVTKKPPPLKVANLKISRMVYLPGLPDCKKTRSVCLPRVPNVWKDGSKLKLPRRPPSNFMEVLTTPIHYQLFKGYLRRRKVKLPLMFWRAVQDMKTTKNSQSQEVKSKYIVERYFGKAANYGVLLDCQDEIITSIATMKSSTAMSLFLAQSCVFNAMEIKWYPGYLALFQNCSKSELDEILSEVDIEKIKNERYFVTDPLHVPALGNWVPSRTTKVPEKLQHWKAITRQFIAFIRCLRHRSEYRLFEMYLSQLQVIDGQVQIEKPHKKRTKSSVTKERHPDHIDKHGVHKNAPRHSLHDDKELHPGSHFTSHTDHHKSKSHKAMPVIDHIESLPEGKRHVALDRDLVEAYKDHVEKVKEMRHKGHSLKHKELVHKDKENVDNDNELEHKDNKHLSSDRGHEHKDKEHLHKDREHLHKDRERLHKDKELEHKQNEDVCKEAVSKKKQAKHTYKSKGIPEEFSHLKKEKETDVFEVRPLSKEKLLQVYKGKESVRNDKDFDVSDTEGNKHMHKPEILLRARIVSVKKLTRDLAFWIEIDKYKAMVDSLKFLTRVTHLDNKVVSDKARLLIKCFLQSEAGPKIRVNVTEEIANNIYKTLQTSGAQRGLFHEAYISLLPVLYHFWKKFQNDWPITFSRDQYYRKLKLTEQRENVETPHKYTKMSDYQKLKISDYKPSTSTTNVEEIKDLNKGHLSFTLVRGIRVPAAMHKRTVTLSELAKKFGHRRGREDAERLLFNVMRGIRYSIPKIKQPASGELKVTADEKCMARLKERLGLCKLSSHPVGSLIQIPLETTSFTRFWNGTEGTEESEIL